MNYKLLFCNVFSTCRLRHFSLYEKLDEQVCDQPLNLNIYCEDILFPPLISE